MMCFGIGAFFGAIIGAVLIQYYSVLLPFGVCGVVEVISTIGAVFMPDSLETNEFAVTTGDGNENFCQLLRTQLKIICENLKEPLNKKFYGFLIMQGLMMPSFPDFEYFFAVDILGLSVFTINMSTVIGCVGILVLPLAF